ncbi:response regulator [Microbacterium sp. 18062]|uniref:response regulator n=1 Tax=Microbacterium sp. 18062 TaxID=2681410 RepID=UPI001F1E1E52|nr:response regulator [Microbacterium sp. 18062]
MLIVDDQELLRRGLRMILETQRGIEVVAEAEDGKRALALIPELMPDVVLADGKRAASPRLATRRAPDDDACLVT